MEIKILEEKNNPLFGRKEVKGTVESEINPSRVQILEVISKKFSSPVENIKIKNIRGNFGKKTFTIEANVYTSEKEKNIVEVKKKKEGAVKEKAAPAK
ncbi:MAG: 30S ribosomal protein S24e [Candidatus Pacearchaeota archaeon]|jgi:ribosomal protein S24E